MQPGKWTHRNFRDVYFIAVATVPREAGAHTLQGWWVRKDFGCGEIVYWDKPDSLTITAARRPEWTEV